MANGKFQVNQKSMNRNIPVITEGLEELKSLCISFVINTRTYALFKIVLYYFIMNTFTLSEKKQDLQSDYCQFLLASFTNFTQTYFADRTDKWSHDQLNRFLRNENIPSSELWASVQDDIDYDDEGYLIFDDVVLSKPHANAIEALRSQWSGSDKKVVEGIGICHVYLCQSKDTRVLDH